MTYVVTDACIRCKYMDCVEVCPVDCFYEGENMLVINPSECIDCGVCEPNARPRRSCPIPTRTRRPGSRLNKTYSEEWPNITQKGDQPADADAHKGELTSSRNISRPIPERAAEPARDLRSRRRFVARHGCHSAFTDRG